MNYVRGHVLGKVLAWHSDACTGRWWPQLYREQAGRQAIVSKGSEESVVKNNGSRGRDARRRRAKKKKMDAWLELKVQFVCMCSGCVQVRFSPAIHFLTFVHYSVHTSYLSHFPWPSWPTASWPNLHTTLPKCRYLLALHHESSIPTSPHLLHLIIPPFCCVCYDNHIYRIPGIASKPNWWSSSVQNRRGIQSTSCKMQKGDFNESSHSCRHTSLPRILKQYDPLPAGGPDSLVLQ